MKNKAPQTHEGETPLAYMLRVVRDRDADHTRRDHMAMAALPYCHGRLVERRAFTPRGETGGFGLIKNKDLSHSED